MVRRFSLCLFVCLLVRLLACSRRSGCLDDAKRCEKKKKSVRGGVGSIREGTSSLPRFLTLRHTLTEGFRFVNEDDNESRFSQY